MFRFTNLIIFRLTRSCNLNCKYCFMKNKDAHKDEVIDFELFKKIINRIAEQRIINNIQDDKLVLVFHGGEVLTVGKEKFYHMAEYLTRRFQQLGIKFDLGMQTNAILLDDDYAKIIQKFNIQLGLSFDGIGESNNDRDIKQTVFESKFEILQKNKISYGFLLVATKSNVDKITDSQMYIENLGHHGYKINYAEDMDNPGENSKIELSGKEMLEKIWIPEIDKYIATGKTKEFHTKELIDKSLVDILTFHDLTAHSGCGTKFCGAGISMIAVHPDGEMDYCDRYSDDFKDVYVQHALDYDFLGLYQLKRVMDYHKIHLDIYKDVGCDTCFADYICEHGCSSFYYSKYGKFGIETRLVCDFSKGFYDYVLKNLDSLVSIVVENDGRIISFDKVYEIKEKIRNYFGRKNINITLSEKNNREILITKK